MKKAGFTNRRVEAIVAAAKTMGALLGKNGGVREIKRVTDPARVSGPQCPKCNRWRTWVSGPTFRCRDCGTRFTPPPKVKPVEPTEANAE